MVMSDTDNEAHLCAALRVASCACARTRSLTRAYQCSACAAVVAEMMMGSLSGTML